ncbi:MAG TPA: response regulator transcription factor [Thermoleophilaceae bacterium]|jgi:DNA-binding NarL/FixJ family response regulator|nr:response regulator transcription factor [Thermoleophilaceae bacterium]
MRRPRVVVVDDHELFRDGVRARIGDDVEIAAEAGTVEEAIELIRAERPHVVLLDVHMPDGGGLAILRAVGSELPEVRFLVLSVSDAPADVMDLVRAGAHGYVTKAIDPADLAGAVRSVAAGEAVFSPSLAGFVLEDPELSSLTLREREVLQLIARGYLYKEVGAELGISPKTVEHHVSAVLRKLQLTNRHQLSRWATKHRLID